MSDVPIATTADLVGHEGTSVTEPVYRYQPKPVITNGAATMGHDLRCEEGSPIQMTAGFGPFFSCAAAVWW